MDQRLWFPHVRFPGASQARVVDNLSHFLPPAAQITNYNHSGLEAKPHKPSLRQSHLIINPNRANGSFHRAWLLKKFFEKLLPLQITTPRCLMIG